MPGWSPNQLLRAAAVRDLFGVEAARTTLGHAEAFMSGLKRITGSALTSRKDSTLGAEAALRGPASSVRR